MLNSIRFMRKHEVSKDLCLKFVRSIIVPSINYGAFCDEGQEAFDDYQTMDDSIIDLCRELMDNIPTHDQVKKLLIDPHECGGL